MFKKQYITGAFLAVISLFSSCTNLDEEIFSSIPEKDFYKTESEFLAAMVPIYSSMRTLTEHSNWWDLEETTDVCVTPVKNHGLWYDGGIYIRLHQHSWMEEDAHLNNIWNALYSGVSSANRVLYQFENSTIEMNGKENYIAELKVARAFYYYLLLEAFGNVPIIDRFDVPDGYLPATEPRSKVFEFVESELKNNINNLSEDVLNTYGRFNKWNAKMLLARLYLNAEAWIGTPMYNECENLCNEIIATNKYRLDGDYSLPFSTNNELSNETMFVIPVLEISKLIVNKGIVNYSRELKFSNLKCVSRITGAEINGTNGLPIVEFEVNNRTNELYNVGGTDLGIVWELQPGHYGLFFGDTFGSDFYPNFVNPGPNGSNWRSNVLLFSDDQDLSDGLTINGATMDESGKNAREICYGGKDGSGNGDWTSIPTAAIRANGIDYVHYMNIRNWAGWITNFSSLYKSSDNGITWTRCQNVKFGSTSNFGQVSYFKKDGYIYMVGTITGRDNKPHLARFLEENIENQTEYEFWNGSGWIKGNETAATPLFNDISGELSIAYHPEFKKWILLYFNSTRYDISFRTADHIIGEWSKPQKLVDGWQYSQLYGSYIHPISLKGNILYFIMSMWLPYNTYLMSAELKCNP